MTSPSFLVAVGSGVALLVVAGYVHRQLVARGARLPLVAFIWGLPPAAVALALLSSASILPAWTGVLVASVLVGAAIWPKVFVDASGGPIPLVRVASIVTRISNACVWLEEPPRDSPAPTVADIHAMLHQLKSESPRELEPYVSEFAFAVRSWLSGVANDAQADNLRRLQETQNEIARRLRARGVDISLLGT